VKAEKEKEADEKVSEISKLKNELKAAQVKAPSTPKTPSSQATGQDSEILLMKIEGLESENKKLQKE
jgi:hypothetical protein